MTNELEPIDVDAMQSKLQSYQWTSHRLKQLMLLDVQAITYALGFLAIGGAKKHYPQIEPDDMNAAIALIESGRQAEIQKCTAELSGLFEFVKVHQRRGTSVEKAE